MKGYTSQPSFDEEGNFTGVEISSGHQPLNRQGEAPRGWHQDELTGETTIFEETNTEEVDYDAEYVDALHEVYPNIQEALQYVVNSGVWDAERQAEHDKAVFSDNYTEVNEAIEKLMSEYDSYRKMDAEYEQNQPKQEQEPVDEDEDSDIPDASELWETEADEELATVWDEYAANSDGAYSLMASLAAKFHSGEISDVDTLVEMAIDSKYSREELIAAFNHLKTTN